MADMTARERAANVIALWEISASQRIAGWSFYDSERAWFVDHVAAAIESAERAAYRRGQERMREAAAKEITEQPYGDLAGTIRALPLEPADG